MEKVLTIFIITLVAEAVWETLKLTWQEGKVSIDRIGALLTSLMICIGVNLNILSLLGIETKLPLLGTVLTGILVSRGSNFVHDLFEKIGQVKGEK